MTGKLTIPLPATCTARYLVHARQDPERARHQALRAAEYHASGCMRDLIEELTVTPAITFAAVTDADLAAAAGWQRATMLREPGGWVSLTVRLGTGPAPRHEWVARTLAGLLAWQLEANVIDTTTRCRLDADEMLASVHAKENGVLRLADWIRIAETGTADGPVLRTRGMRRYGLPDLILRDLVPTYDRRWSAVLTAVAFRVHEVCADALNQEGGLPAGIEIPDQVGLRDDDVEDAYCLPGSYLTRRWGTRWMEPDETTIGLSWEGSPGGDLTCRPPRGWTRSWHYFGSTTSVQDEDGGDALPDWPALSAAEPYVSVLQRVIEPVLVDRGLADPDLIAR